ncbi:hypothetical protein [Aliikangiella maris]|uniref:DUF1471 domain-containing protein n=2 Tax=Aliikangiella maris TaxID=3162458 RepID=A0ABV3MTW4_9GAMM
MKNSMSLLMIILIYLSMSTAVNSATFDNVLKVAKQQSNQKYKVKAIYFNGSPTQAEKLLQQVIIEQATGDWVYDSYIDLKNENVDAKLLVFKRKTKK